MITTRTATLADLDTLLTFEQGIISTERPFDPTLKADPINYYNIAAMIEAPHIERKPVMSLLPVATPGSKMPNLTWTTRVMLTSVLCM